MRILLDLDEILVDFIGGACRAFNVSKESVLENWTPGVWSCVEPIGKVKGFDLSEKFFWAVIHEQGERFWTNLEPLPWATQVLDLVKSLTDDWHIVSAPSADPSSYSGKVKWLKNYFGKDFDRFALTPHKQIFAGENTLLIDDKEQNIIDFIASGGDAILFPRHHNSLYMLKDDPVGHLRRMIDTPSYLTLQGVNHASNISEREQCLRGTGQGNQLGFDPDQKM